MSILTSSWFIAAVILAGLAVQSVHGASLGTNTEDVADANACKCKLKLGDGTFEGTNYSAKEIDEALEKYKNLAKLGKKDFMGFPKHFGGKDNSGNLVFPDVKACVPPLQEFQIHKAGSGDSPPKSADRIVIDANGVLCGCMTHTGMKNPNDFQACN
ncbi:hypothetical protein PC9H_000278 [Pleurotus ostreatus]|uniref:Uncharacterized protein n=1 Tax=Pleurotus ostreatus TaxID=5322 RepID=A0A8H7DZ78_PLEOS|nr:uncharacterized protein PC9H_000278 [Pleurotus ostreatus]KAF7439941.1 hypothetical protein PC9H_000278 [Pleurotus ostreatus]KAJ8700854.1 hypothetical protein PTI98_003840 [Pleurotus ostreatus]